MSGTIPVYRWRLAPDGLATRRQLRAAGLRPGGQDPVAVIERPRRRGRPPLVAYLYLVSAAVPVRPMTPARWRAIEAALTARRTCPDCGVVRDYCIPTSIGVCNPCDQGAGWAIAA
ncbi:RRQRL motif-containing zinc-binding protein [Streptomyces sp. NBRC 109706]|uniref:RRQRL motif-containing zinc-binding protein n=1 Tax=Streptomyces sp. NBRC 109706 TaxID=1550035 RepID=UPI00078280F5|nr:RRQRL motif-containing zinc-binding protein [Streptomyces sp. NBRC 109706]